VTPLEVFGSNWTGGKLSAEARNKLTAAENAKWDAWSARVSPKPKTLNPKPGEQPQLHLLDPRPLPQFLRNPRPYNLQPKP